MAKRQVILLILDGWGVGPKNESNPIFIQGTPNIDFIKENYSIGALQTSGITIGLPSGIKGNSEGHQTLAAGRLIYQHYPRITASIIDGSFAKNPVFLEAFDHVKKQNSSLNLAGLLTEGNIHASLYHLRSLIKLAKANGVSKINLHLFSDGKDSDPKSGLRLAGSLAYEVGSDNAVKISSVSGRYFALEREGHWDRTEKAYKAITGDGPKEENLENLFKSHYEKNLNDLYIEPHVINPNGAVKDGDSLLFFNFREDSMRQLVSAFVSPDFNKFPVKQFNNLHIASMTSYSDKFKIPAAFPPEKFENPIGKVLADNNKLQIRIGETEKYAHITYFFNGFRQEPFKNEFRVLIPSEDVVNYAEKPAMQAKEVTTRTIQAVEDQAFDFILVNYSNGDMVAHTGNIDAAKEAVKIIDEQIGRLLKIISDKNITLIITSDHGNIESMRSPETGEITTTHDLSAVPIYIIGKEFAKKKTAEQVSSQEIKNVGTQADVAPTILEILGIPKPKEMTGNSLKKILKK